MKYTYKFVTGEIFEIEVTEELGAEILDMEKAASNKERAETRRHQSLDAMDFEGGLFSDNTDIAKDVLESIDMEALHKAIAMLLPQQRALMWEVFFEGKSITNIAEEEGTTKQALNNRLNKIYRKLKKILK